MARSWDWDPASENLHGLSREVLVAQGSPRQEIAAELRHVLSGHDVLSDSPASDQLWLARLFGGDPGIRIGSVYECYERIARDSLIEQSEIDSALAYARQVAPIRHRAADDVRHHMAVLEYLLARGDDGGSR